VSIQTTHIYPESDLKVNHPRSKLRGIKPEPKDNIRPKQASEYQGRFDESRSAGPL
jgi:hypothetical protein